MRFLEYHAGGTGLVPARKSLALVVGGKGHDGLAGMLIPCIGKTTNEVDFPAIEEAGVKVALAAWDQYVAENGGVEVESNERVWEGVVSGSGSNGPTATGSTAPTEIGPLVDFNMPLGIELDDLNLPAAAAPLQYNHSEFESYTQQEQRALLEGMLRAYARRRLRPLLEEYEVLEVEREGEWKLSGESTPCENCAGTGSLNQLHMNRQGDYDEEPCWACNGQGHIGSELWFASRPDALLLHRESGSLHLLSYKTTGAVDLRKLADIQHDDQGLSEGVEIERRLREAWEAMNCQNVPDEGMVSDRMAQWLHGLASPPRIDAIRYEFLLKGERWKDKRLSEQVGFEARTQKSPLVKGYQYSGRDPLLQGTWCWSWDYEKPDGSGKGSLNWQNWKATPVWQTYGVKEWIDLLDSGKAQQIGQAGDALEAQFHPPQLVYRSEDDLRDWIESTEAQEVENAENVEYIQIKTTAGTESERSLLNRFFPMNRSACEYPGRCAYADKDFGPCYGPAHARSVEAMLESGKYVRRVPNHPQEGE